ncbi:MAG TPA: hypothetical protein VKC90_10825 [Chitinophagaceae bacterium]|nr:hypothetical protein [Chitinophagaceae bacterium]
MKKTLSGLLIVLGLSAAAQNSFSPVREALRLFNKYKPTIEKDNDAIVDEPKVISGDINNDSLEDCIIFFVMTSKDGGNVITDQEAAIYINKGNRMKVVGAFPKFNFCYAVDRIDKQVIYLKEYKCAPPYNEFIKEHRVIYLNGTIKEK